jgi:hypothetical protein
MALLINTLTETEHNWFLLLKQETYFLVLTKTLRLKMMPFGHALTYLGSPVKYDHVVPLVSLN